MCEIPRTCSSPGDHLCTIIGLHRLHNFRLHLLDSRLGFKTCLSKTKTKTKTCLSKTKTKTLRYQDQDQDQNSKVQDQDQNQDSAVSRPRPRPRLWCPISRPSLLSWSSSSCWRRICFAVDGGVYWLLLLLRLTGGPLTVNRVPRLLSLFFGFGYQYVTLFSLFPRHIVSNNYVFILSLHRFYFVQRLHHHLYLKVRSGDVWMFDRCRNAERPECRPTGLTTMSRCQVIAAVWSRFTGRTQVRRGHGPVASLWPLRARRTVVVCGALSGQRAVELKLSVWAHVFFSREGRMKVVRTSDRESVVLPMGAASYLMHVKGVPWFWKRRGTTVCWWNWAVIYTSGVVTVPSLTSA